MFRSGGTATIATAADGMIQMSPLASVQAASWTNQKIMYGFYQRTHSVFQNSEMMAVGKPSADELALLESFRGKAKGPPSFSIQPGATLQDWAHANLVAWRAPLAKIDPDAPDKPHRISQEVARALAQALKLAESEDELTALETKRRAIDKTTTWSRTIRSVVCALVYGF